MESTEGRVNELLQRIREVLTSAVALSSDPGAISASKPYRDLVELGEPAVGILLERLRAGDHFLNDAVLQIANLKPADLGINGIVSEQQISAAIVAFFEPIVVEMHLTANSAIPVAKSQPHPQNATVRQPQRPLSNRIARLIEQRA